MTPTPRTDDMTPTPRTDAAITAALNRMNEVWSDKIPAEVILVACDLERENAELRTDGQRWQNEHLRLLAENAELREALNLAFSIHQMSDRQLGDLIRNCRKIIGSKP